MARLRRADVDLHYNLVGAGPPVLLIQGVGVAGGCWKPQVEAWRRHFQILSFDNRGLGQSTPCRGPITIESMPPGRGGVANTLILARAPRTFLVVSA